MLAPLGCAALQIALQMWGAGELNQLKRVLNKAESENERDIKNCCADYKHPASTNGFPKELIDTRDFSHHNPQRFDCRNALRCQLHFYFRM